MPQDQIRTYLDAKDNLDKTYTRVQQMRSLIAEIGQKLLSPYNLMVSDVGVGFPAEVAMGGSPSLKGNNWPSATQIAENLAALHDAYHQVQNAWRAIPEQDRKNLVPPPEQK